ncbi:hypothetical protein B0H34DRAFT_675204 [Crassisporium funariophilum]|nr:hypothetical protein B0H34DRAFT_675204 [Crassisporium funariophilum]
MSPDRAPDPSSSHASGSSWQSIRPWAPSLTLSVHEITSVSATFILSSTFSDRNSEDDPSLATLGLDAAEEDSSEGSEQSNGDGGEAEPSSSSSVVKKRHSVIADALAKGLSVNVNGSAWPRAFIRIDDQVDEAVIIIYALMPGRQYDIELGLAPAGQTNQVVRRQVTTDLVDSDQDTAEIHTDPESPSPDNSTSSSDPNSTPSTSPSRTVPGTPPTNAAPQITLEERLTQVQHTLSLVNAERETLLASLKSARRDAQKADAALRSEIDTLKRTSEKHTANEVRGKQKVLALQEAAKRAQNATKETEESVKELEEDLPELNKRKEEKEEEYRRIKLEAEGVRRERESVEEKERKKVEAMRTELAGLCNKLEKLNGRKEKLEGTVMPELEGKLKEVEREIEEEEQNVLMLEMESDMRRNAKLQLQQQQLQLRQQQQQQQQQHQHQQYHFQHHSIDDRTHPSAQYVPTQRMRHHSHPTDKPAPIGRPTPAPIQRPPPVDFSSQQDGHNHASLWGQPLPQSQSQSQSHPLPHSQAAVQRPQQHYISQSHSQSPPHSQSATNSHNPRSLSFHNSPPALLTNPQRRASLKSSTTYNTTANITSNPHNSSPTSLTSSPTWTNASVVASSSTLSSRAPAFEPTRSMSTAMKHGTRAATSGFSVSPTPIHRPRGNVGMGGGFKPAGAAFKPLNDSHGSGYDQQWGYDGSH